MEQGTLRPCRYGDACRARACRYGHPGGALCKYFPRCLPPPGQVCGFRHPPMLEAAPAVVLDELSPDLLTALVGPKRMIGERIPALERALACSLRVDFDCGRVTAVATTAGGDAALREALTQHLDAARNELQRTTMEVNYMGTTRAVIGDGFEAKELLFGDEFRTLSIGSLKEADEIKIQGLLDWGLRHHGGRAVERVEDPNRRNDFKTVVHVATKHVAAAALAFLKDHEATKHCTVEPFRQAPATEPEVARSALSGQVTISWAMGRSKGSGTVYFASAVSANAFLRSYHTQRALKNIRFVVIGTLPDGRNLYAGNQQNPDDGDGEGQRQRQPRWLPPLCRDNRLGMRKLVLFDDAKIREMPEHQANHLQFGVEIQRGLPLDMDERALCSFTGAVQCSIDRTENAAPRVQALQLDILQLFPRAGPLVNALVDGEEAVHFVDKASCREGVAVTFHDEQRMQLVYSTASYSLDWRDGRMDIPYSQPVRLGIEYFYRTSVLAEVFDCFRKSISRLLGSIRNKGVWYSELQHQTFRGRRFVELRFRSLSRDLLQRTATALNQIIECEHVDRKLTPILSSLTGRRKLQEWIDERNQEGTGPRAFVQYMRRDKACWVYGERTQRQAVIQSIRELVSTIVANAEILDRMVRLDVQRFGLVHGEGDPESNANSVRQSLMQLPPMQELYHFSVLGDGSRMVISGSVANMDAAMNALSEAKYLLRRDRIALAKKETGSRPDCGVCTMPVDEPVVQFALCGHSFCRECIEPGVTSSSQLPLRCPTLNCEYNVHVNDIARITNDVGSMVETAVFDYVAKHPDECVVCPKAGCNQILSLAKLETDACGGQFLSCESCSQGYCLACSDTTAQAVPRHNHTSCQDFQQSGSTVVDRHALLIRERILTLKCPACQSAFLDFDGCTCVQCGNATCRQYFCANCLAFSSSSSNETHAHVRTCPKNPLPGEYFLSAVQLTHIHKQRRVDLLCEYLTTHLESPDLQTAVLTALTNDLADLDISLHDVLSNSN